MEFNRSFEEIIKSVCDIFNEAKVDMKPIYHDSPEFDLLDEYCDTHNYSIRNGLTKFVFNLDNNDNFVVKIPFAGTYYWADKEYENYGTNHCEEELNVYEYLKDSEIGSLLVPTVFIGKVNGLELYAQPKVEVFNYDKHSPSDKSYNTAEDLGWHECTADDDDVVASFVEYFGVDEAERILDYLDEEGIRDIHSGNFGYLNGALVLFDYCGYHS
jgi:hypothetical protein